MNEETYEGDMMVKGDKGGKTVMMKTCDEHDNNEEGA